MTSVEAKRKRVLGIVENIEFYERVAAEHNVQRALPQ